MFNSKIINYRIRKKIHQFSGKKITDDFDWDIYNTYYRAELEILSKSHIQILNPGDYKFENDSLLKKNQGFSLHPNHRLLYETIMQLNPDSIMEMGCGAGDHLYNIGVLSPNAKLFGLELSEEQIFFLRERHKNLNAEIKQFDITLPNRYDFPEVDIAYTQAVIMHIKTGNGHLSALSNLFRVAKKFVILMENWKEHEFMGDILFLYKNKMLPWEKIFFYYRDSEEFKKPHIMIVSAFPLKQYPILEDYKILKNNA